MKNEVLAYILPLVRRGDVVRIVPKDNVPNATRQFTVEYVDEEGFSFYDPKRGRDLVLLPYCWIKRLAIVGHEERN